MSRRCQAMESRAALRRKTPRAHAREIARFCPTSTRNPAKSNTLTTEINNTNQRIESFSRATPLGRDAVEGGPSDGWRYEPLRVGPAASNQPPPTRFEDQAAVRASYRRSVSSGPLNPALRGAPNTQQALNHHLFPWMVPDRRPMPVVEDGVAVDFVIERPVVRPLSS